MDSVTQPSVSVVIVSWNARDYLAQCLNSLTHEVCRYPMEIIVVDNNSSDGSAEMVQCQFPHVQLICNDSNVGFARANNLGIRGAKGDYLCLINSDIKVYKDCITRLVEFCETHTDAGMVGPRIVGADGKLQRSCRGFPNLWNMACRALALDTTFPRVKAFGGYALLYWAQESPRTVDILSGCFWMIRRDALARVGLLDESFFMYGEDMDWCKRFWKEGWQLVFVPSAEAMHYGGASSANAPVRFFIEMQRADLQYWRKHHSRLAVGCYMLTSCVHLLLRAAGYGLALAVGRWRQKAYREKLDRSVACLRWLVVGQTAAPGKPLH